MEKTLAALAPLPILIFAQSVSRPWQQITVPSINEAAANFKSPPHEYCDQSFRKLELAGRQ